MFWLIWRGPNIFGMFFSFLLFLLPPPWKVEFYCEEKEESSSNSSCIIQAPYFSFAYCMSWLLFLRCFNAKFEVEKVTLLWEYLADIQYTSRTSQVKLMAWKFNFQWYFHFSFLKYFFFAVNWHLNNMSNSTSRSITRQWCFCVIFFWLSG